MTEWQDKYLAPSVSKRKVGIKDFYSMIRQAWKTLIHSLSPHNKPENPPEELPNIEFNNPDVVYDICKDIYNNSNERIDKIEDKAVKLLSFITILFALISFLFLNVTALAIKIVLLISIILLLLSLLIAFRCVNIKARETIFIPHIYNFDDSNEPEESFDINRHSKKILQAAIYNQNVADNTTDLLKSAWNLLFLTILFVIVALVIATVSYNEETLVMYSTEELINIDSLNEEVAEIKKNLNTISEDLDTNRELEYLKIDKMNQQLEMLEEKHDELMEILSNIESSFELSSSNN